MIKRKTGETRRKTPESPTKAQAEIARLRHRLAEAEESLDAIRCGSVDALVIKGPSGDQIFTLKNADRPYRIIIERMKDGALTVRDDGLVLYANRQFAAMLGLPLEKLLGSDLFDLAGPGSRAFLRELIDQARNAGAHGDIEFPRHSGRPLLLHMSLAPMKIDGIQAFAGVAADITEERLIQQRLRQMDRTEALGRLAGGVAHDLNNILQPIIVNAELLLDEEELGTQRYAMLRTIHTAALRQKALVSRILSFTRRSKPTLQAFRMGPLVDEALKLLKPSLPASVEVRCASDTARDTIIGDANELHELVTNLVSNAVDAMPADGGTVDIVLEDTVLTEADPSLELGPGDYLKLTFRDTGCGIAPHNLEKIFEPFFTTKHLGKGTGIGLSIVRGIVKGHGGGIALKSREGEGTEVTVCLPSVVREAVSEVRLRTQPNSGNRRGRRVLVVDDDGTVLETLGRALLSLGHTPTALKSPAEALGVFRTGSLDFDLAIIDQSMPGMSGLELATAFKRLRTDLPIVLVTGYSEAIDDQIQREAGVAEVLMKPLSLRELAGVIDRVLPVAGEKA